ncbi:hypothetical protein CAPTEDRAFT_227828 [Capitella teleta]|uniref:Carbonic anhydrase n=1 Tax=Capitella teleta TaxID=283909 RepID=R7V8T6_CAPTE|nr:hypothetical protein CAPTEDRAFT_227828 [Capitella teleta]|eukprot:ELU14927.1 hypothetical protein CAPTEDRAFT_227828 [Capitella teleta]
MANCVGILCLLGILLLVEGKRFRREEKQAYKITLKLSGDLNSISLQTEKGRTKHIGATTETTARKLESAIASLGDEYRVSVTWEPFLLRHNIPPEGVEKPPNTPGNPRVNPRLKQAGQSVGIDFSGKADRYPNTVQAHALLEYAKEKSPALQDQLMEVVFRGYFTDGIVPSGEGLVALAMEIGIGEDEAKEVIGDEGRLRSAREKAMAWSSKGVSGVPHFFFNGKSGFSGAQEPRTHAWTDHYAFCAADNGRQSPIDIQPALTIYEASLDGIKLTGDAPLSLKLLNNGHTVVGIVNEDVYISGGGLGESVYKTHSLHFHWGDAAEYGSEHTVDGAAYPLEMHIVHYDSVRFPSLKEAAPEIDGLAVLGVLFEESDQENAALNVIIEALSSVQQPLGKENIIDVASGDLNHLSELLPSDTEEFFRYSGSLTTPPCFQSVVWTVFSKANYVSRRQLEELRKLVSHIDDEGHGEAMVNNYRPTQPLEGRNVMRSFEWMDDEEFSTSGEEEELDGEEVLEGEEEEEEELIEVTAEPIEEAKEKKAHWSYRGYHGPEHWSESHEMCDSSNPRQSPVNIIVDETVDDATGELTDIDYIQDNSGESISYFNNGHSIVGVVHKDMVLVGGGLSHAYKLHSFHFHWGRTSDNGSEHTVNGERFPLELHMVHYDHERAASLKEAVSMDNGLAVLGTLFEISKENNTAYDPIIVAMREVQEANKAIESWHSSPHFEIRSLLPVVTEDYFRYLGSLTTPPCAESVVWTLFRQRQRISEAQMQEFRRLLEFPDHEGVVSPLVDNYRPVQPLHKRLVTRSFSLPPPKVYKPVKRKESSSLQESKMQGASGSAANAAVATSWLLLLVSTVLITHF